MSEDRVERDLAELPDGGGPRPGWEGRVLASTRMEGTGRVAALARPRRRQPLGFALAGAGAVVLASVLFFALRPDPEVAQEKAAQQMEQLVKEMEAAQVAFDRAGRETDEKYQRLLAAKTEEEKAAAQAALDRVKRQQEEMRNALKAARARARQSGAGTAEPEEGDGNIAAKCDPNDPLCGI